MIRIALGILLLATAASTLAATEHDQMEKGLKKYGAESGNPSKTVCVCQDGGVRHGRAGWFNYNISATGASANCGVPTFNATTGAITLMSACDTFEVIGK